MSTKKTKSNDAIKNLVIVESPAKAKTIEGYLGADFTVMSSYGHIRDLNKSDLCIDIENGYQPMYSVSKDKEELVKELKRKAAVSETIWLASDEDREGEAISWHIFDELKLSDKNTKRIVFHEITKTAILKAIETPRKIDQNLVDAQQARRVLDRLVGYELSPVLWKKVKPSLSAGRVQSVAVRLIVEREREVQQFKSESAYRVVGVFELQNGGKKQSFKATLPQRFPKKSDAEVFLQECQRSTFTIGKVEKKPSKKSPSAPFTTSTLQQEASRKLGYSVSQTMVLAQKLYEAGKISYMRTDSVNLSETALDAAKNQIAQQYGPQYHQKRIFANKNKGAQEAHEAIRPTDMATLSAGSDNQEKKLYELIWKRTIASQMSDAALEKTTAQVLPSESKLFLEAQGEVILFDGFLRVYSESVDEAETNNDEDENSNLLPPMTEGQRTELLELTATQRFSSAPPRYTEASLVKKLEELGIGRPSTYAPTISTVQKRNYVIKEDRDGMVRSYEVLRLKNQTIGSEIKTENTGAERNKLFPTDIGAVVNDFLQEHFEQIMDFHFTAKVEKEFDEIAEGLKNWSSMIDSFYKPFHKTVDKTLEESDRATGARLLGQDPKTGKSVYARIGRYGPLAQIGENEDAEKRFANLRKGQRIESISLDEALDLFKLPRSLGEFELKEMVVGIGKFGPYIRHNNGFYSLAKTDDPMAITSERGIELILAKRESDAKKVIQTFDTDPVISILNGRYGPYISQEKENYKIPKDKTPEALSLEDCLGIIAAAKASGADKKPKRRFNKNTSK
ncbi:MAG: type I DNA topoisomerase [Bacteroidia bacterium]|jgi:DNA topoisomerase-1